jgi:hypothetical protein
MRGSIWSVVALFVGAAMAPAILDVDVAAGSTGETILSLLTVFDPLLGLAAVIVAFGLLLAFFTDSGGF